MTKTQRICVLTMLVGILALLWAYPATHPIVTRSESVILLTALFMLSFTTLLLEHFFAKPTDVLSAAVSILFLLIPSRPLLRSWGIWYWVFLYFEVALAILATTALLLLVDDAPHSWRNRASALLKTFTVKIGDGRTQYFVLTVLSVVFFVEPRSAAAIALLLYSLLVMSIEPQRVVKWLPRILRRADTEIGEIMAVEGGSSYLIRLNASDTRSMPKLGSLVVLHYEAEQGPEERNAVVVEKFLLDRSRWLRAACHQSIDEGCRSMPRVASHRRGAVFARKQEETSGFFEKLVGFVSNGSDIGSLRFLRVGGANVAEGDLLEVSTNDGRVIYQVVNGRVDTETLDKRNLADFVVGEAIQLGAWDQQRGAFIHHGWVPNARTPVTKLSAIDPPKVSSEEIVLGCIPGTEIPILLNRRDAISHHTAILGVTGVGKSMFARKLVSELATQDVRVIVVDFTREWKRKLKGESVPLIIEDIEFPALRDAIKNIQAENAKFPNQRQDAVFKENKKVLHDKFCDAIDAFMRGAETVGVFELPDLSNTEGVLEYTQWFFKTLFQLARGDKLNGRKVCIVLEEAHTVVPEWNFVGIADAASKSLVNNISQIALQGRKYDVGFIVIAQRTANVSKTVLTQCNTIVAFQCFDGTSLEFLGHYLPKPMLDALPNLGFRRAIAVGKAIRSSVPLIFEVPDLAAEEKAVNAPAVRGLSVASELETQMIPTPDAS